MGFGACSGYTAQQVAGLKELYKGLAEKYPKSAAVKRIPLESLEGADFLAAAEKCALNLRKPPLTEALNYPKPP
eukprot:4731473-Pyramimonas_sp.AAC.1